MKWLTLKIKVWSTYGKTKPDTWLTPVACGWAGPMLDEVTRASGQEWYAQKAQKRQKSNKAGYTANTVADGWAGACLLFQTWALPTDQRTNGPADKASYRVTSPRLKIFYRIFWNVAWTTIKPLDKSCVSYFCGNRIKIDFTISKIWNS